MIDVVLKKRAKPEYKGFSPDYISIYEQSAVLYETAKLLQQTDNITKYINKYGKMSLLQLVLQIVLSDELCPYIKRHIINNVYEVKPGIIANDDKIVQDLYQLLKYQKTIF